MRNLRTLITGVGKFIMPRNNSQLMTSTPKSTELNTITARSPLPSQMKKSQNMKDTKFTLEKVEDGWAIGPQRRDSSASELVLGQCLSTPVWICQTLRYDLMAR